MLRWTGWWAAVIAVAACGDSTGCCPGEGPSGPVFEGVARLDGAPRSGATVRGLLRDEDDCEHGRLFGMNETTTAEDGTYSLHFVALTGVGDGVGSHLTTVCGIFVAEHDETKDSVRLDGVVIRALVVDTIQLDFDLGPR